MSNFIKLERLYDIIDMKTKYGKFCVNACGKGLIMKKTGLINLRAVIITILCLGLNMAGRKFATSLNLPLWADSFGTVAAAYALGPFSGAVVGAVSCFMLAFSDYHTAFFGIVAAGIGIGTGYFARRGAFDSYFQAITCATAITSYTFVSSSVLDLIIWGGTTGNIWGDAVIKLFKNIGINSTISCFIGQFYLEFADKFLTVSTFYLILKIIKAVKYRHPDLKKATSILLLAVMSASILTGSVRVYAETEKKDAGSSDYSSIMKIYDAKNGLTPGHATSIAVTRDGRLWIGTYAGLYSYDGKAFTLFQSKKILNVNCLFTDREGRLWVGTNDSGLSIIINGELVSSIDRNSGLPVNSIRSVTQGSDGRYYVGTAQGMAVLNLSNGLSVTDTLDEIDYCVASAALDDGYVAAVDGNGGLYLLQDGRIIFSEKGNDYSAVATLSEDTLCAGNNKGGIDYFKVGVRELKKTGTADTGSGSVINSFLRNSDGTFDAFCDNGMYRNEGGDAWEKVSTGEFNSAMQRAARDYQGNLWIASTRQGLLEISSSAYTDYFKLYGISPDIMNAVLPEGNYLYMGCDDGLIITNRTTGERVENSVTDFLKGVRVRALAADNDGNIYAATYGRGLVMYDLTGEEGGRIISFNGEDSPGSRVRTAVKLSDGRIAASGDKGLSFIDHGRVSGHIPYGGELGSVSILCIAELPDGRIILTTDGDGYYVLSDDKVEDHITESNGVRCDVVLKAVPSVKKDTFFLVTSNGIVAVENGKQRQLSHFPYSNNYDIISDGHGKLYITGSAGIYITTENDLLLDKGENTVLSGLKDGLPASLTANSMNKCLDNNLYLCSSAGLIMADMEKLSKPAGTLRLGVKSLVSGGREYMTEEDDRSISGGTGTVVITPEIINFLPSDPLISWKLQGYDKKWKKAHVSEMSALTYTDLPAGNYTFLLAVRDSDGKIREQMETAFTITEELWQRDYFLIYIILVAAVFIGWLAWFITRYVMKRKSEKTEQALLLAEQQVRMGNESVIAMTKALFMKDRDTGEHSHRVAYYASKLGEKYGFSEDEIRNLRKAAILHDIGKIAVPDAVLNKPGKLTDEEYEIIKSHAPFGADILKGFTMIRHVQAGARYHHERYDGKGYPDGLAGEEIPLYGRIISIADSYDAMTAKRVYRNALEMDQVISELKRCRGTQFDPELIDLFLELISDGEVDPESTIREFRERDLTEDIE